MSMGINHKLYHNKLSVYMRTERYKWEIKRRDRNGARLLFQCRVRIGGVRCTLKFRRYGDRSRHEKQAH